MFYEILNVVILPPLAILLPFLFLALHIMKNDLELSIGRKKILQFGIVWVILSLITFLLLLYLTGDFTTFYFLEPGVTTFDGGVQVNLTQHLGLTIRYDPGLLLFSISVLSSLLYATIIVLPPVCTYIPNELTTPDENKGGTGATLSSGFTATVSAVGSTAVCCSTSVAAIIAPAIVTVLGPFVDYLFYFSIALLLYSFYRIAIPRFPVV